MPKHKYQVNQRNNYRAIEEYQSKKNQISLFDIRTLGKVHKMTDFEERLFQALMILMIAHSVQGDNDKVGDSAKDSLIKSKNHKHKEPIEPVVPNFYFSNTKVRSSQQKKSSQRSRNTIEPAYTPYVATVANLDSTSQEILKSFENYISLRCQDSKENIESFLSRNLEAASYIPNIVITYQEIDDYYQSILKKLLQTFQNTVVKDFNNSDNQSSTQVNKSDLVLYDATLLETLFQAEVELFEMIFPADALSDIYIIDDLSLDNLFDLYNPSSREVMKKLVDSLSNKITTAKKENQWFVAKNLIAPVPKDKTIKVAVDLKVIQGLTSQANDDQLAAIRDFEKRWLNKQVPIKAIQNLYVYYINKEYSTFENHFFTQIKKTFSSKKPAFTFQLRERTFYPLGKQGIFTETESSWYHQLWDKKLQETNKKIRSLPNPFTTYLESEKSENYFALDQESSKSRSDSAGEIKSDPIEEVNFQHELTFWENLSSLFKSRFSIILGFVVSFVAFVFCNAFVANYLYRTKANYNNKLSGTQNPQVEDPPKSNKKSKKTPLPTSAKRASFPGSEQSAKNKYKTANTSTPKASVIVEKSPLTPKEQLEINFDAYDTAYSQAKSSIERSRNYCNTTPAGRENSLGRAKNKLLKSFINFETKSALEKEYLKLKDENNEAEATVVVKFNDELTLTTNKIAKLTEMMDTFMDKESKYNNSRGKAKSKETNKVAKKEQQDKTTPVVSRRRLEFFNGPAAKPKPTAENNSQTNKDKAENQAPTNDSPTCDTSIVFAPHVLKTSRNQSLTPGVIKNMNLGFMETKKPTKNRKLSARAIKSILIRNMKVLYQRSTNQTDRYFPNEENNKDYPFEVETGRRMCLDLLMKISEEYAKEINENQDLFTAFRNQIVHKHHTLTASEVLTLVTSFNDYYDKASNTKDDVTRGLAAFVNTLRTSSIVLPLEKPRVQKNINHLKSSEVLLSDFVEAKENEQTEAFDPLKLDIGFLEMVYDGKFLKHLNHGENFSRIFSSLKKHQPDVLEASEFSIVCIFEQLLLLVYKNNYEAICLAHPRLTKLRNIITHESRSLALDEFREFFNELFPAIKEILNSNQKVCAHFS